MEACDGANDRHDPAVDIHEQTVIVLPHVLAELRAHHLRAVIFVAVPLDARANADLSRAPGHESRALGAPRASES
jgi:hypothetical protein